MSWFVTGTDTDVGKTYVSGLLIKSFLQKYPDIFYYKPVQSGAVKKGEILVAPDIELVNRLAGTYYSTDASCGECFEAAMSPYQAALKADRPIAYKRLLEKCQLVLAQHPRIIIEGAGGVLVPLAETTMMIDLMRDMGLPVIVVVRAGLGTINHSLLTFEALKTRNIPVAGFIVNRMPVNPSEVEKTNPEMIENRSGLPCLAVVDEQGSIERWHELSFEMAER